MKSFEPEKVLGEKLYECDEIQFHKDFIETKTVLGIDIYRYSEYPQGIQEYVPVLFNSLYKLTVALCHTKEGFIFQKYGNSFKVFKSNFISTGDGGFQIFDNPIQAIIFAAYFQLNVRLFNSNSFESIPYKNLYKIIGRIELRYTISTDKIYLYDGNFYGPAIINNSRILAKDHLNRLLIDFLTIDWFDKNINTIENLLDVKKKDLMEIKYFESYDNTKTTLLFEDASNIQQVKSVDILRIGSIRSKNTLLDIYNLRIQFKLSYMKKTGYKAFIVTLGNLNTQGIE